MNYTKIRFLMHIFFFYNAQVLLLLLLRAKIYLQYLSIIIIVQSSFEQGKYCFTIIIFFCFKPYILCVHINLYINMFRMFLIFEQHQLMRWSAILSCHWFNQIILIYVLLKMFSWFFIQLMLCKGKHFDVTWMTYPIRFYKFLFFLELALTDIRNTTTAM